MNSDLGYTTQVDC